MANLANMNLEINEEVIQTIFRETLNQSIVTAMGNKEEYMSALINSALTQKVDEEGNVSKYSYENKFSFLDAHVKKTIREAAKDAINEYLQENKEILKAVVKKEMEKEENKSALVNAFVKGAVDAFNYNYSFRADVKIGKNEDEF
ncbi:MULTISPECIES: hypothetical protein [Enterococcus]|uniref:Uncharacterized protein n=1 Tax=Enterococcus dongliensis TaxID=2559925 RepID=A0AAW8TIT5_9ENTE|nr:MULTISPECIES: hypothetical protein [Enterococcus]MBX8939236.1 hypothetical protein [Enterococcus gilvus]MDT2637948.1 hypothetical protein [Enterococcus dongliensis]